MYDPKFWSLVDRSLTLFSRPYPGYDPSRSFLIKQTYTVFVETPRGQRKWHLSTSSWTFLYFLILSSWSNILVAYFTEDTVSRLRSIDDVPQLASLSVPHGKFKSARSAKGRPDYIFNPESDSPVFPRLEYVPHAPRSPSISPTTPHTEDTWSPVTSENEPMLVAHSPSFSGKVSSEDSGRENLVPLHYLQDNAPPRRNPTDEKILMLLTSRSFQADDSQRRFGISRPGFEA